MMLLLLLLGAFVGMGLSYEQLYGSTYKIRLLSKAYSIEFTPSDNSDMKILWKENETPTKKGSRGKVVDYFFVMSDLTQRDSGRYVLRDRYKRALSTTIIHVIASTKSYTKIAGEEFSFTTDLESKSCNILFFPESDYEETEREIVHEGRLMWHTLDQLTCFDFSVIDPCGILNERIKTSCRGHYEVRDSNGDTALVVHLEVHESAEFELSYIGIGVSLSLAAICCRCCVKCCGGGKNSSKKEQSETAEDEPQPAAQYQDCNRELARLRPDEMGPLSEPDYPAQPSFTLPGPLIHNPPPMGMPPAYSECNRELARLRPDEMGPLSEPDYPAQPSFTLPGPLIHNPPPVDTLPAYSEVIPPAGLTEAPSVPAPQFELKGMTFPSAPLLNSESCDVYTSDKLNFP